MVYRYPIKGIERSNANTNPSAGSFMYPIKGIESC